MFSEAITLVERYGSFGLLVLLAFWLALWVVPRLVRVFADQGQQFAAALAAEREARERQHVQGEQTHRGTTQVLAGLVAAVRVLAEIHRPKVEDETQEYAG